VLHEATGSPKTMADRDLGPIDVMADFVNTFAGLAHTHQKKTFAADADKARSIRLPLLFIAVLLFGPPAIRFVLGTSSNTAGLILACLLLWGGTLASGGFVRGGFARWSLGAGLCVAPVLVMHLGIAVFMPFVVQSVDLTRTSISLIALVVTAVTAGVVADWLSTANTGQIERIGFVMRIVLVLVGLWSAVGHQPPSPLTLSRPAFPFPEPSHYVLVAAAFVIDGCVRAPLAQRFGWLAVWLFLALINKSLSLIVATAIAAVVSLPIAYAVGAVAIAAIIATGLDLQYYLDRLDFSANSNNLSSLVYRQGWELMQQGLVYSRGLGIGFQQLGFTPLNVPTSDLIYRILGDDSNLRDGSFLAAKLVSELGILGIVLVAMSVAAMIRAALLLRRMTLIPNLGQPANMRFAAAAICAFATEMFVRGIGYFSSTVILFIAAIMVLNADRRSFNIP